MFLREARVGRGVALGGSWDPRFKCGRWGRTFPPGGSQKGEESDPPGGNHPSLSIPLDCDEAGRILCVLCNDLGMLRPSSAE